MHTHHVLAKTTSCRGDVTAAIAATVAHNRPRGSLSRRTTARAFGRRAIGRRIVAGSVVCRHDALRTLQ